MATRQKTCFFSYNENNNSFIFALLFFRIYLYLHTYIGEMCLCIRISTRCNASYIRYLTTMRTTMFVRFQRFQRFPLFLVILWSVNMTKWNDSAEASIATVYLMSLVRLFCVVGYITMTHVPYIILTIYKRNMKWVLLRSGKWESFCVSQTHTHS